MFLSPSFAFGQKELPQFEAIQLTNLLTEKHVEPIAIDNAFAGRVWNNLIAYTDPDRLYFTAGEADKLKETFLKHRR